jgi:hypothetical protein
MHGLVNRAIQCFLTDSYGLPEWTAIAAAAGLSHRNFEAMLVYDGSDTFAVLDAAAGRLSKTRAMLLEDLGTWLVSNPRVDRVRRLLRFGGDDFVEFLHSLDDLQGRVHLALPDLDMAALEVTDHGAGRFTLSVRFELPGFGLVFLGVLRAMADEYGALVFLEHSDEPGGEERIAVEVIETDFSEGRDFALAVVAE